MSYNKFVRKRTLVTLQECIFNIKLVLCFLIKMPKYSKKGTKTGDVEKALTGQE
jgi:hypothetical protein